MIWSAALLAGGAGLGLWLIVRAWFPAARPLDVLSAELASPRRDTALRDTSGARGWWSRLAPRVVTGPTPSVLADMSVVGTTPLRHGLDKLHTATMFGAIGLVPTVIYPLTGLGSLTTYAAGGALVLVVLGWFLPDLSLRSRARSKRIAWDGAITVFVDVVGISLAGGAGVDDALMDGASAGSGDEMAELASTLFAAQTRRKKLWVALEDLGHSHDLGQLRELAAAMDLAGESGSRVRDTLRAKATALRIRQLTDAEADAQKASETMSIAPALMAIAAIVLIAYPAVAGFLE